MREKTWFWKSVTYRAVQPGPSGPSGQTVQPPVGAVRGADAENVFRGMEQIVEKVT